MNGKRAVIFVNGLLEDPGAVAALINEDDFLIAADGGLRHVLALGLTPHLLIGDLDSASTEDVAQMESRGVAIQKFPAEKDETDIELALLTALDAGYRRILLAAALGGRLDHMLGNLSLLTNPDFRDADVRLDDGHIEAFVIWQSAEVQGRINDLVSLLPLDAEVRGVTTQGLAYALDRATLLRHQGRGISNVMVETTIKVTVENGVLLCIHSRQ